MSPKRQPYDTVAGIAGRRMRLFAIHHIGASASPTSALPYLSSNRFVSVAMRSSE